MKKIISAVVGLVVVLGALQFMWLWGFCRFYVGPNDMAIITAKNGEPLEPGQILARGSERDSRRTLGRRPSLPQPDLL